MATVTGFTAARMLEIENTTIVDGNIEGDNLILVTRGGAEIDAGVVRGPEGPQGPNADVGDIKTSIRSSITGWLAFGMTHTDAESLYPELWALAEIPASWKSGSNLVLPSMTDTILQGGGTPGSVVGANTVALVAANLPAHAHSSPVHSHAVGTHTHTINHDHPSGTTGLQTANHTHTINHNHPSGTTSTAAAHAHNITSRENPISGSSGNLGISNAGGTMQTRVTEAGGAHAHTFDVASYTGSSGTNSGSHNHGFDIAAYSGSSGGSTAHNTANNAAADTGNGPGTSAAVNIQQKALKINYFIKY